MAAKNVDFISLYDRYVDSIYRFVYFRVNDEDHAWDITQDCFLKALEYMEGTKVENPRAFLYQVARNMLVDFYRAKEKKATIYLSDIKYDIPEKDTLIEDLDRNIDIKNIMVHIDKLPEHHKDLIILRYVDGLSFAEIAEILGKNQVALRVQTSRIIKELKLKFE